MPRFSELDEWFVCPYRDSCPYLEGLSAYGVWEERQAHSLDACHYEYVIGQLHLELDEAHAANRRLQQENQQLRAQLQALHRRQFKGRRPSADSAPAIPEGSGKSKKRGAPFGHPPWQRPKPMRVDQVVPVPAPTHCPDCGGRLGPMEQCYEHVQEDIVLQPRTVTTLYLHHQGYCARCGQRVLQPGPGELPGAYIGPAAKATAIYLRYELHVSDRKISRFFADFFGLRFVPASVYGFERQAVRRGQPLYADLVEKVRALPTVHADETSWRHDGQPYWLWYAGDEDLACYHLDAHRSSEAAQQLLGEHFGGVLVADAYAAYNGVHPKDRQSCLAHIKTKAKELGQELALLKGRAADSAARQFCADIQGWVRRACQAHHRLARRPWRPKTARKQHQALRRQLRRLCRRPLRYPRAEAFRQRLLGPEQKYFFTCFRRPKVPPTNNQAERSLRPAVIMRRIVQGTRSPKGLENHSVLRSLLETARRQGKRPHQFLLQLFTRDTLQAQAALYRRSLSKALKGRPSRKQRKPP
jgi:transposase